MATPGKISRGLHEESETLIANEEVLFGQPVTYDTSNDNMGVRRGVGEDIAGMAMYDASAGTDDDRNYAQYDVMEILEEGTAKVRVNQKWTVGTTDYYAYFTQGDPVYAPPEGYLGDGRTYFAANPEEFHVGGNTANEDATTASKITTSYFGPAIGKIEESTGAGDEKAVVEVEFDLPAYVV